MIDYTLITNPMHAKAIWLLANTCLPNRAIGRKIGMDHSQVWRVNIGYRYEKYDGIIYETEKDRTIRGVYNDRVSGTSGTRGLRPKMTADEELAFAHFESVLLPVIIKIQYEEKKERECLFPAVYEVYKITEPSKNYIGESDEVGKRATQHFTFSSNPSLQEDMLVYGKDAFAWRILERIPEELNTSEYRREREGYYMRELNPYYNAQPGSRPFLLIDSKTLQVVGRFVTLPQANKFVNTRPDDTNFGRLLHGVGITYKGHHAVYEDEYTEDWQPRKDNRLRGNKYA